MIDINTKPFDFSIIIHLNYINVLIYINQLTSQWLFRLDIVTLLGEILLPFSNSFLFHFFHVAYYSCIHLFYFYSFNFFVVLTFFLQSASQFSSLYLKTFHSLSLLLSHSPLIFPPSFFLYLFMFHLLRLYFLSFSLSTPI